MKTMKLRFPRFYYVLRCIISRFMSRNATVEINDKPARIGTSNFFFDVWYKITNEKALVPCGYCGNGWNADSNEPPKTYFVGDYSRDQFNSVLFQLSISKSSLWEGKYDVEVLCFADTRKYGAETIVYMKTDDPNKIDSRLFEYAADVLSRSGAVLDHKLNQKKLDSRKEEIAAMQAYNDKLARIMQIDKISKNFKEHYSK